MPERFSHVAVLKGGPGHEREVSLKSGAAVAEGLRDSGYTVDEVDVRDLRFELSPEVEAVFVAVHGSLGEDGLLQWELEQRGIPFTGSRSAEMARSIDKEISKALLKVSDLPTADWEMVGGRDSVSLPAPCVLKAPREGSSIGVEIAMEQAEIAPALERVRAYADQVLVERFITGRECTVGVLGSDCLPIVEIRPHEGRYDFEAKYERGDTHYLCPAEFAPEQTEQIQALAAKAFQVLGGRHLGRVDFRVTDDGEPFILELNPIPGFTPTSLLPKAAAAMKIDFSTLCARIMEMAE